MKILKRNVILLGLLSVLSFGTLTGCKSKGEKDPKDAPNFVEKTFIDFTEGEPNENVFVPSHNTTNGGSFGCVWSKNNISYDDQGMHMTITYDAENDLYYGGEFRTATPDGQFNRGYFSAEIKVAKTVGVATTFFLYTGEYEGNPHDEIDIEFLGKDTTKVQFNYYGGNNEGHEFMYDLGFDASLSYHKYGFYWDYDQIVWYVDNVPVYKATENIPFHDMRMYTNFWKGSDEGGIMGWMGKLNKSDCPTSCSYKKIYYADSKGQGVTVPAGKGSDEDLLDENMISLFKTGFESKDNIIVTKNDSYYDVSLTQAANAFRHLDPLNFAFLEFGDVSFSKVKIKNLDNTSYPIYFMKDNTLTIAKEFENKYKGIVKAIHQENKGHGGAVQTGINNASGIYIKVVDSDDWVNTKDVAKLLEVIKKNIVNKINVDLYIVNYVYERTFKHSSKSIKYDKILPKNMVFCWNDIKKFPANKVFMMHSLVYKTSILKTCGLSIPEHTYYVDNYFCYQPLPYCKDLYYFDNDFYHYFLGRPDQSCSDENLYKNYKMQMTVVDAVFSSYKYDELLLKNKKLRKYMIHACQGMYLIMLIFNAGGKNNLKERKEAYKNIKLTLKLRDKRLYKKASRYIACLMLRIRPWFLRRFMAHFSMRIRALLSL